MISGVHISSNKIIIDRSENRSQHLPQFRNNDIVKAEILKQLPDGRALLLVNNQKITAKTSLLLEPGKEFWFKVSQQQDEIIFKLVNPGRQKDSSGHLTSLVRLFGDVKSVPDINRIKMPQIRNLFYETALKSDRADRDFLPRLLEKGGLSLEKKIGAVLGQDSGKPAVSGVKQLVTAILEQDLKGAMLLEKGFVENQSSEAGKILNRFIETLENFQVLNSQNSEAGKFLLPFSVFSDMGFSFAQLLIDTGGNSESEAKEDRVINISFLLDMTRLGALRADFSILKKEISGRFLLKDHETRNYVKSMIPELKSRLSAIEYKIIKIDCKTGKDEQILPGSLIEELAKEKHHQVLNIVI